MNQIYKTKPWIFGAMKSTKPDASDCVLAVFEKPSQGRVAWAWFHDVWTCAAKVLKY
jgi:hypothetical protein